MSWIVQIDTALETAIVSLAFKGKLVAEQRSFSQKDHASFLQPAIAKLIKEAGITLQQISAVAVVDGPGSYTGLRVGMASSKGLCYALNKPLVTINSLKLLAATAKSTISNLQENELICPMIDARRMEVFTAVYNANLEIVLAPCAMELSKLSFDSLIKNKKMYFLGNGSTKWAAICPEKNGAFVHVDTNSLIISELAWVKYLSESFASIAYAVPTYLKDFYTTMLP